MQEAGARSFAGRNHGYFFGKGWFAVLAGAYSRASDKTWAVEIKLGGWQLGAGAGLSF